MVSHKKVKTKLYINMYMYITCTVNTWCSRFWKYIVHVTHIFPNRYYFVSNERTCKLFTVGNRQVLECLISLFSKIRHNLSWFHSWVFAGDSAIHLHHLKLIAILHVLYAPVQINIIQITHYNINIVLKNRLLKITNKNENHLLRAIKHY